MATQLTALLLACLAGVLYPGASVLMLFVVLAYAPWLLVALVLINVIPGYLSLRASRAVLYEMAHGPTPGRLVMGFVGDGVISLGLACLAGALGFLAVLACNRAHVLRGPVVGLVEYVAFVLQGGVSPADTVREVLRLKPVTVPGIAFPSFGIWFYAPCFSTVWVWLYTVSGCLLQCSRPCAGGCYPGMVAASSTSIRDRYIPSVLSLSGW